MLLISGLIPEKIRCIFRSARQETNRQKDSITEGGGGQESKASKEIELVRQKSRKLWCFFERSTKAGNQPAERSRDYSKENPRRQGNEAGITGRETTK
jgi:hypothetical protein